MQSAEEALNTAAVTLEKYRKNKTMVSPEDLAGKYKVPFDKLQQKLRAELSEYLQAYCLRGIKIRPNDSAELVEAINRSYRENGVGKAVYKAAFEEFDIAAVQRIAQEHRKRILALWNPYFQKHTCLYTIAQNLDPKSNTVPRIYNDLVDKFYDAGTGKWIDPEPGSKQDAVLIFITGEKPEKG